MDLKLNIYEKNGKKIEKTYRAETADIMFGTIEDLIGILEEKDTNSVSDMMTVVKRALPELKDMLKYVFEGLTDDEIRRTKTNELVTAFVDIFRYAMQELGGLGGKK